MIKDRDLLLVYLGFQRNQILDLECILNLKSKNGEK